MQGHKLHPIPSRFHDFFQMMMEQVRHFTPKGLLVSDACLLLTTGGCSVVLHVSTHSMCVTMHDHHAALEGSPNARRSHGIENVNL